ncbi:hypothetical protein CYMTET_24469, partial [Cymbomonas tetramitiformis]
VASERMRDDLSSGLHREASALQLEMSAARRRQEGRDNEGRQASEFRQLRADGVGADSRTEVLSSRQIDVGPSRYAELDIDVLRPTFLAGNPHAPIASPMHRAPASTTASLHQRNERSAAWHSAPRRAESESDSAEASSSTRAAYNTAAAVLRSLPIKGTPARIPGMPTTGTMEAPILPMTAPAALPSPGSPKGPAKVRVESTHSTANRYVSPGQATRILFPC